MNKQIIIDGVDVSGCKYYDAKKLPLYNCLECINHFKPCMSNNCYYKKLIKYKQALTEIKQLLEDALDTDKTNAEQSFDNFYKAIELCEVLDVR